jgi:hypothetical protein
MGRGAVLRMLGVQDLILPKGHSHPGPKYGSADYQERSLCLLWSCLRVFSPIVM